MIRRVNLALMETVNAQRNAERNGRPTLHPLAEYYGDWERERLTRDESPKQRSPSVFSLTGDDAC